jgi:L-amino acid N-acyltransferase YncA
VELLIREARPDDAGAIVRILNPIIEAGAYSMLLTPFTAEAEREFIVNFPPRGIFHVVELLPEQRVVGFQTIEPFATYTCAFDHVAVMGTFLDLNERRRGIGTRLAQATFEAARRKGIREDLHLRPRGQPGIPGLSLETGLSDCRHSAAPGPPGRQVRG